MSETIEQKCLAKGVKLTDQRRIIAQVMSESSDHPDVDELYNRVSKIDPKISIATVYRTVKLFEETGIIYSIRVILIHLTSKSFNEYFFFHQLRFFFYTI